VGAEDFGSLWGPTFHLVPTDMQTLGIFLLALSGVSGFQVATQRPAGAIVAQGPATITKPTPSTLPDTWSVPDTFTFPPRTESELQPMYKVTLFRSSSFDTGYMIESLMKVCALDDERATTVANQAQSMGFALVGVWVQEVAEMYYDGLKSRDLVVDLSPEA